MLVAVDFILYQSTLAVDYSVNISALIEKGDGVLFKQGNYTKAIKYYDKVLDIDANNVSALNNKGLTLYNLEKYLEVYKIL